MADGMRGWRVAAMLWVTTASVVFVHAENNGTHGEDALRAAHLDARVWQAFDNTPADNPITEAGAELGRALFYDTRLSLSGTTSCASCHQQERAFADARPVSLGHAGAMIERNAMSLVNLRYVIGGFLWDERAEQIEDAVRNALYSEVEMGLTPQRLVRTVAAAPGYDAMFAAAFGSAEVTEKRIVDAIGQFVRTLVSVESRYDIGAAQTQSMDEDFANFTALENRGKALFMERCHLCHHTGETRMVNFFGMFRSLNNRVDADRLARDGGRGDVTLARADMGVFRAPSLRNVEVTGPYMHDGRFATLEEVVDHYATMPGIEPASRFTYSAEDKQAIIAFLHTLTDERFLTNPRFADPWRNAGEGEIDRVVDVLPSATTSRTTDPTVTPMESTAEAFSPAERVARGIGLRVGEVDAWLDSLDVNGDGALGREELAVVVEVMVATDRLSLQPVFIGRRVAEPRRAADGASMDAFYDMNGDGSVDETERRRGELLVRLVRLDDGGRLEVLIDRVMMRFAASPEQDPAIRVIVRKHKSTAAERIRDANRQAAGQLRAVLGDDVFERYQLAVIRFAEETFDAPGDVEQQRTMAREAVWAFDTDGDGAIAGEERRRLVHAMEQTSAGFGYRGKDKKKQADPVADVVQRLMRIHATDDDAVIDTARLPERMIALVAADHDADQRITADELTQHVRNLRFDTLVANGIYIGGGFANALLHSRTVLDELSLDADRYASAQAILRDHEHRIDAWLVETQRQVFVEVADVLRNVP